MAIKNILNTKSIYNGRILTLKVSTVVMDNGNVTTREMVEHKCSAAIIATTDEDEIILVEQERYGLGLMLELPAGIIECDETPMEIAIRELKEETGYKAQNMYELPGYYTSVGFTNEKVHLFRATGLISGEQELDINEDIKVVKMPIKKLKDIIYCNVKLDSKVLAAVAYLSQEV